MYRWNPAEYNQHLSMQTKFAHDQLARHNFSGSERVLDLACGDGKITASIASRLPHGSVLGIEISSEMIGFARQNFPRDAHAQAGSRSAQAIVK